MYMLICFMSYTNLLNINCPFRSKNKKIYKSLLNLVCTVYNKKIDVSILFTL